MLTSCQADADAGLYAASMSGFVRWLASRHAEVTADMLARSLEFRANATVPGMHSRTPDIVADLAAAFEVFLDFARQAGAIKADDAKRHFQTVWDGLMDAATPTGDEEGTTAAETYLRLIAAALAAKLAHLVNSRTGEAPIGLEAVCGWHRDTHPTNGHYPWVAPPNSSRIGWTDGSLVFLDPDIAFQLVQKMATAQGESFPVGKATVHAQLDEARKVARKDTRNGGEGKNRITSRESVEKRQRTVLVIRADEFWSDVPDDLPAETPTTKEPF